MTLLSKLMKLSWPKKADTRLKTGSPPKEQLPFRPTSTVTAMDWLQQTARKNTGLDVNAPRDVADRLSDSEKVVSHIDIAEKLPEPPQSELTTVLPPIHLINLDRSTDRLQRFHEINGHLGEVRRVAAADGSSLDRQALIATGYITEDLPYAAGTLGCAMSHIRLWEMAARENRSITIFEDDIVISLGFLKQATHVMSSLPQDWDIVQWGYIFQPSFVWVDLGVSRVRLSCYGAPRFSDPAKFREFQEADLVPAPVKLLHSFGTQAYSISAQGARSALQRCLPLRKQLVTFPDAGVTTPDLGIDGSLCGIYPELKAYICLPQLILLDSALLSVRQNLDAL